MLLISEKDKNKNYNSKKEQTRKNEFNQQEKQNFDDQVEGRNSVLELLESGKDINKIFITKGEKHGSINKIIAKAKENGIIIVEKDKNQMRQMAQNENYQGVIAIVPPYEYCEIEDILEEASKESSDWKRLEKERFNLIEFESFEFERIIKKASKVISSHADEYLIRHVTLTQQFV